MTARLLCKDCRYYQPHRGKYAARRFKTTTGVCKLLNYQSVIADKTYCEKAKQKIFPKVGQ